MIQQFDNDSNKMIISNVVAPILRNKHYNSEIEKH